MKNHINTRRLQTLYFTSTFLTIAGTTLLLASVATQFMTPTAPVMAILTPMSLFAIMIGIRMSNNGLRKPTPVDAISLALKGISKSSTTYHYYPPAKHFLVSPHGLFTITAIPTQYHLTVTGLQWENTDRFLTLVRQYLLYGALKDPVQQAARDAAALQAWLNKHLDTTIPVTPIILFTHPDSVITILKQPPIHVTAVAHTRYPLKDTIRIFTNPTLSTDQTQQLATLLKIRE